MTTLVKQKDVERRQERRMGHSSEVRELNGDLLSTLTLGVLWTFFLSRLWVGPHLSLEAEKVIPQRIYRTLLFWFCKEKDGSPYPTYLLIDSASFCIHSLGYWPMGGLLETICQSQFYPTPRGELTLNQLRSLLGRGGPASHCRRENLWQILRDPACVRRWMTK